MKMHRECPFTCIFCLEATCRKKTCTMSGCQFGHHAKCLKQFYAVSFPAYCPICRKFIEVSRMSRSLKKKIDSFGPILFLEKTLEKGQRVNWPLITNYLETSTFLEDKTNVSDFLIFLIHHDMLREFDYLRDKLPLLRSWYIIN